MKLFRLVKKKKDCCELMERALAYGNCATKKNRLDNTYQDQRGLCLF
ncbi:MAG: hypothetical protein NO474_02055 [Methanomassiliicoccales archaeon]|nr:hypothetical protein [Methanomassiliicoccales archaeon]